MATDSIDPVEPKLYIFPHTGGSAEFYLPFARAFTGGTKCVAVQYPGKRAGKDLSQYTSIPEMADRKPELSALALKP